MLTNRYHQKYELRARTSSSTRSENCWREKDGGERIPAMDSLFYLLASGSSLLPTAIKSLLMLLEENVHNKEIIQHCIKSIKDATRTSTAKAVKTSLKNRVKCTFQTLAIISSHPVT